MPQKRGVSTPKSQSSQGHQAKREAVDDRPFLSTSLTLTIGVLIIGALIPFAYGIFGETKPKTAVIDLERLPETAQAIDQRRFNVLERVPPPSEANATTRFLWPGVTHESLLERPFHVYDAEFLDVIGNNPTLTLLATSDKDPIFHEAVVWNPPTDEVFFVQSAGSPDAGTGLEKSSIIQKISLADAEALRNGSHTQSGTNYKGQIIFAGEGQGENIPSALYLMNPERPYNTTMLVNNYFGRQFNSINDVSINPRNGHIYFTDTMYGYWQHFRPEPGLRNQVYRLEPDTGALTVVADGFAAPNGITFSPDGRHAYITDTGLSNGLFGVNPTSPASIYRFDVQKDGSWDSRKTFAYVGSRLPDGIHCDSKGNVYAGCGDGVHVWNPSGKLIGKIYTGMNAANFQLVGNGRMIIMGRTKLFFATIAASEAPLS
ncbi:unnamed protein product [Fusarium venenatum]|uniref:SMP-30/Gluconolactonase/LRE-like region domain-containing protein n=1 Tax=Fusarium venenatum TaxID=56646 RepID=A0A2L2SYM7_9HYPO|nr:uncharacterized protein FVRRES_06365 [Fusarium venenatum]CEI61929.1 unnamed protein product [Fusarium venenatum]